MLAVGSDLWYMIDATVYLLSLAVYGIISGSISLRLCITELVMPVSCVLVVVSEQYVFMLAVKLADGYDNM